MTLSPFVKNCIGAFALACIVVGTASAQTRELSNDLRPALPGGPDRG